MVDLKVVVGRCGLGGADKARFELSRAQYRMYE